MCENVSIWLFWLIWILLPTFAHCFQEALFRKENGVYFANNVLKTEDTSSEMECCSNCLQDKSCTSVNYKTSGDYQGFCELHAETLEDYPQNGIENHEFSYFEKLKVKVN
jgi:hypothetical protein